jgi:hypothetical protein
VITEEYNVHKYDIRDDEGMEHWAAVMISSVIAFTASEGVNCEGEFSEKGL